MTGGAKNGRGYLKIRRATAVRRWETWPAFVPNINDSFGNLDGREVFDHARRLAWVVYDNFDTRKSVPRDGPAPHGGFQ